MPSLSLQQKQVLSAAQVQTLSILTAPANELVEIIEKRAEQNPFMLLKGRSDKPRYSRSVSSQAQEASDRHEEYLNSIPDKEGDIKRHLSDQIEYLDLTRDEEEMCRLIISNLDDRGFFVYGADELLEVFEISGRDKFELYERMVDQVSRLDPIGCAASDVYDSLRKQISILRGGFLDEGIDGELIDLASGMINEDDFTLFSKGRTRDLALKYDVDSDRIGNAFSVIRRLDPNPARDYSSSPIRYVAPTVRAVIVDNEVKVSVADGMIPAIEMDRTYDEAGLDSKGKRLLESCRNDIALLNSMIDSRNATLSSIAYFMISKQLNWLLGKTDRKVPLMLKDIALYSNMSVSTASRIVSSNYLEFENRVIPLSDFLERSADGSNSKSDVISAIAEIIRTSAEKLSDEKIRRILESRGISISRRTVQKYRALYLQ